MGQPPEPGTFVDRREWLRAANAGVRNPIRWLYHWVVSWAHTPHGAAALVVMSFVEAVCFPIPPDVLLIPLVLGARERWLRYALICTLASIAGGLAGYGVGYGLWDLVSDATFTYVPGFNRDVLTLADGERVTGLLDPRPEFCYLSRPSAPPTAAGGAGEPYMIETPAGLRREIPAAAVTRKEVGYFTVVRSEYDRSAFAIVFVAGFTPIPYKLITVSAGVARLDLPMFVLASAVSRAARFFLVAALLWKFGGWMRDFIERWFNTLTVLFTALLVGGFYAVRYLF
ncbi:MAG: DedA family protein [Planctomycetes bacterium]|nr:DedA family protein [Planctomycetota bacterium]